MHLGGSKRIWIACSGGMNRPVEGLAFLPNTLRRHRMNGQKINLAQNAVRGKTVQ
jgi:hypothetical protein